MTKHKYIIFKSQKQFLKFLSKNDFMHNILSCETDAVFANKVNYKKFSNKIQKALLTDLSDIIYQLHQSKVKVTKITRKALIKEAIYNISKLEHAYSTLKSKLDLLVYKYLKKQINFTIVGRCLLKNFHLAQYPSQQSVPPQIMMYVDNPHSSKYGIYTTDLVFIENQISLIDPRMSSRKYKDLMIFLRARIPFVQRNASNIRNKIAVKNGIFDFESKKLLKFSPKYVFNEKLATSFNKKATKSPVLMDNGKKWTFDKFIEKALGKEQVKTFWQTAYYFVDGAHSSGKLVWLKGDSHGRNGKSTLQKFLTEVAGAQNVASTRITDFGEDFGLSSLPGTVADIGDNINSNARLNQRAMDNVHSIVTGDPVECNIKNVTKFSMIYDGQLIMSSNGDISFSDNNGMLRRLIVLRFNHVFEGDGDKVKDQFTKRKDVREYILNRILMQPFFTSIKGNSVSDKARNNLMKHSDPVLEFAQDFFLKLSVNKIPTVLVYHMYLDWANYNNFNDSISTRTFNNRFISAISRFYNRKKERINSNDVNSVDRILNNLPFTADPYKLVTPVEGSYRSCFIIKDATNANNGSNRSNNKFDDDLPF